LFRSLAAVVAATLLANTAQAVTIDTVPARNLNNAPDTRYSPPGYGAVNHAYNIGKYEVTAGQYRDFLNAVDPSGTNTLGLYNASMNSNSYGCQITWNSGSAKYDFSGGTVEAPGSTAADWENRPVNYVSFWDAARFANWLHNGQGSGDTENGAYHDIDDHTFFGRNADARFFIPTENEWYKAAYHDKSAGLAATYFDYPTSNNSVPGRDMSEATNPGNNANYYNDGYVIGDPYYRTEVGEFELSESPYGTFDQGGNLFEWNEARAGSLGGLRGGPWDYYSFGLHASSRDSRSPTYEYNYIGFRVASIPEPGSISLLVMAAFGFLMHLRRRR
jgi:sulfatase modifying factor 1